MDNKQLKSLLKILRDNGVLNFKTSDIELQLSPLAILPEEKAKPQEEPDLAGFPDGILSPEQLMFYSSGGNPEDDPYRDQQ